MEGEVALYFRLSQEDVDVLARIKREHLELLMREDVDTSFDHPVTDSATRFGYYLLRGEDVSLLQQYMPENK